METSKNKVFVLFGGTGDLAYRKLFPALYNLNVRGCLPDDYQIIGIGRRDYTAEEYIEIIRTWVQQFSRLEYTEEGFDALARKIRYLQMDMKDVMAYERLGEFYEELGISDNIIYYYAVSPELFRYITKGLTVIHKRNEDNKVIVEKPFGKNLEDAGKLNRELEDFFRCENIYRIDHYLGKEMLMNIMTIRFHNTIFKGIWNKDFIDNIQINAFETVGVGSRAGYYDQSGATKDMVQNHLLQILTIIAMEEPTDNTADAVHKAQERVLDSFRPVQSGEILNYMVKGRYRGYTEEENVAPDSKTETYAALKFFVENERWTGVPFYIRTGKKMGKRESEVRIQFKGDNPDEANVLLIRIQPAEGIVLKLFIKKPGTTQEIVKVSMDYWQSDVLENIMNTPEAYERLIQACRVSEKGLFTEWEQIQKSWSFVNKMVALYAEEGGDVHEYEPGSYGPLEANRILAPGSRWIVEDQT
ncbi:MAG: glucose-6-phosphate dehydrogenase [Eubacteriales bacterium]|nr:glucose-6-phosphate dehydrogenase [Eubacteriales bacterium]